MHVCVRVCICMQRVASGIVSADYRKHGALKDSVLRQPTTDAGSLFHVSAILSMKKCFRKSRELSHVFQILCVCVVGVLAYMCVCVCVCACVCKCVCMSVGLVISFYFILIIIPDLVCPRKVFLFTNETISFLFY